MNHPPGYKTAAQIFYTHESRKCLRNESRQSFLDLVRFLIDVNEGGRQVTEYFTLIYFRGESGASRYR